MGLKAVGGCATVCGSASCCEGHSAPEVEVSGIVVDVVAMTSMPVLSMPRKTSRLAKSLWLRSGTVAFPMGALTAGTILSKVGVVGSPVSVKLTGELLHVLRTSTFEVELPPAMKAKAPVEENAIEVAGAD